MTLIAFLYNNFWRITAFNKRGDEDLGSFFCSLLAVALIVGLCTLWSII